MAGKNINTTKLEPDDAGTKALKGKALYKMGKYDEAIQTFDLVIEQDPDNVEARSGRGTVRYKMGKYDEALEVSSSDSGSNKPSQITTCCGVTEPNARMPSRHAVSPIRMICVR
jgi:tetratricopeptide (TPR) repeat protein